MKNYWRYLASLVLLMTVLRVFAQNEEFVFGDPLPDAPALAARGSYGVGVRTLNWVNPDQVDVLKLSEANPTARYDRPLTVEVWYPAVIPSGTAESTLYTSRIGSTDVTFAGRALRDAEPDASGAAYPLVIVSHGYPGSRFMMTYLTEHLASKGYVVVAIDHTDSTFADTGNFFSTLLNRALDQNFVLNEIAQLSAASTGFLSGLVNADNTAIIGYSMGGFGTLNAAGAGYNAVLRGFFPPMETRMAGNAAYTASLDARIKAIVVFAPWGGDLTAFGLAGVGVWDAEGLAGIQIPSLWIAGSLDDVSGYQSIVGMFDNAVNSERYLLTYENALHNVAPNSPPATLNFADYERFSEPAWNSARLNNINQHFVSAFLAQYLGGEDHSLYLQPQVEKASEGVVKLSGAGTPIAGHTYWAGFLPRTAVGMSLRFAAPE